VAAISQPAGVKVRRLHRQFDCRSLCVAKPELEKTLIEIGPFDLLPGRRHGPALKQCPQVLPPAGRDDVDAPRRDAHPRRPGHRLAATQTLVHAVGNVGGNPVRNVFDVAPLVVAGGEPGLLLPLALEGQRLAARSDRLHRQSLDRAGICPVDEQTRRPEGDLIGVPKLHDLVAAGFVFQNPMFVQRNLEAAEFP
jgi:hypothetical protein